MLGQVVVGTERVPAKDIGSEKKTRRPFKITSVVPRLCFHGRGGKALRTKGQRISSTNSRNFCEAKNLQTNSRGQRVLPRVFIQHQGSKKQVVLGTLI